MRKKLIGGALAAGGIALVAIFAVPGPRQAEPAPDGRRAPAASAPKPGLRRASLERGAITTLRIVLSAQAQFQAASWADEDGDGMGEYGSFAELSGAVNVRDGAEASVPMLAPALRQVEKGRVERDGYRFRIYLPGPDGLPLPERDRGGIGAGTASPDVAEACWCAYAWPVAGEGRTFFVNQTGDILSTTGYAGDREPQPSAAFADDSGLAAPTAIEGDGARHVGADGREWRRE